MRKRKLQQFLNNKFRAAPLLASEVCNQQNATELSRGQLSHASSVSSLLDSVDSTESLEQKTLLSSHSSCSILTFEDDCRWKKLSAEFSVMDYATDRSPLNKDVSPLVDSDESVNGSNSPSSENLTVRDPPLPDLGDSIHGSSSNLEESNQTFLHTPRRSPRLLNFIGDHLQRTVIPVGPHFQADVPDWIGPVNKGILRGEYCDSETLRWLGTRVWPNEDTNKESTGKAVGKGRPDSCSCVSPGSTDCSRIHILEQRLLLQYDLGPTFFSWKFDEMGEEVSKSWTLKEQQSFDSLVKVSPPSKGKNFLKHALKCFPCKCKRNILSYYFNVSIPRRMSMEIRSSLHQVDSDDKKVKDVNYVDLQKTRNGRSRIIGSPKDVKSQYFGCRF
ncbi:unnamed protein product [Ilex paraguariensis]|uniref:ELM2 domain-containing protein n=1 Tax=Ilex paraguariensis TaxID=185542 RepID=A0ABC8SF76_9AQUA